MIENSELEHKLHTLVKIARIFNEKGYTWAIGGSCMMYLHGIVDSFQDIDIMVSMADAESSKQELLKLGLLEKSTPGIYATKHFYEFVIDNVDIDVMAGFAIIKDNVPYDCSFVKENIDMIKVIDGVDIPLESLEKWAIYYHLMGRDNKANLIKTYMKNK